MIVVNLFQILAFCGMLSPIIYTLMWILGGILIPEYSHIRDDVSTLIAVDAPKKKLFDKFIISSSILLFVFYIGLHWGVNNGEGSIIGPILGGIVWDVSGPKAPFIVSIFVELCLIPLYFIVVHLLLPHVAETYEKNE